MSIKPWDKYQPNALLPSAQYPYGGLKQETTLGAGNGTPLDVDWGNDFEAFKQTAFSRSGLTPSGNADTVTNSEMFNAMQDTVSRNVWKRLAAESGYNLVSGSFEDGTSVNNNNDCVWYKKENKIYFWVGTIPVGGKIIPSMSSPSTTGGISPSGWQLLNDTTLRSELVSDEGSGLIGYSGPTGLQSNVQLKLRERVTIKDFGGVGNDSADNTSAFTDAVAWMISTGRKVIIPEGSFITDPFAVYALSYSNQIGFVGEDKQRSIIKRLNTGSGAFITFGNNTQTLFCVTNPLTNLTINGGADTNGDTVVIYDLVRGVLDNVKFSGGTTALRMYGGISARVTNYTFELAKVGFKATKYASSVGGAGGGWPNLITLSGGEIVDNKHWGVYFDDGRMLRIRDTDIEGNGSIGFNGGGLYAGVGIGDEVKPNNVLSLGVLCDNVWFESNIGVYDFGQDGGYNRLKGCTFHSIGTTNDFAATAGRYKVSECDSTFTKANNFNEGAGVLSGNVIEGSEFPNLTYDANKTEVRGATATNLRNGGIMSANGYSAPRELVGQDNVAAVSNITFNPPFKTGTTPRIYTQVLTDDSTASHYSVEVYNITNTGFTMRKKKITSGTATTTNYDVMWRAVGEAN